MADWRRLSRFILGLTVLTLAVSLGNAGYSFAEPPDVQPKAYQILRKMSEYMDGLEQFSAQAESELEVILFSGEKIQYNKPVEFSVKRPNKMRADRKGDNFNQALYYNGSSLTLYQKEKNCYATVPAPATIEEMLEFARQSLDLYAPAGDLLYKNAYNLLLEDTLSGYYVGLGIVDGARCHHLAFRGNEVDWQIWIEEGGKPLPKRFIITSKWMTGAPQCIVTLKNWNLSPQLKDENFNFLPAKNMEKIDFISLATEKTTLH